MAKLLILLLIVGAVAGEFETHDEPSLLIDPPASASLDAVN